MAVREFNGTSDTIAHSTGALSGMTFGTCAAIFAHTAAPTEDRHIAIPHDSGGNFIDAGWLSIRFGTTHYRPYLYSTGYSNGPDESLVSGTWYLVVARKATGSATPRFSIYNFTSTTWTHGAGDAALANWTSPGASGTIRTHVGASGLWDGRLAVRACWADEVHWTADTTGDTALEAAGLEDSLQNWVDETPDALWAFNQDPLSAVDDIVGAADQSAVNGTTVVTGDDPPGFSFDLGGGPELMPRAVIVVG